ncbi:MAG TPA: hypothetical protein VED40_10480 [Azospirillaceae bacterium]|nr:hypothetical protein [Azospirillaceae bacterium]
MGGPGINHIGPAGGAFREAGQLLAASGGSRFQVRVIRAGLSANGNFYPDTSLREAAPLFEGARVFAKSDAEHLAHGGKDVRNLIGRLTRPAFVAGAGPDSGELQAELEVIDPADPLATKLRSALERGMADLFGLSIDAEADAETATIPTPGGPRAARIARRFRRVHSVDLIVEPGAGGRVISLIEANGKDKPMDRTQILALLKERRPDLLEGQVPEQLSEDELMALLKEAMAKPDDAAKAPDPRLVEARAMALARIQISNLPPTAKRRLQDEFKARTELFVEADVNAAINDTASAIADTSPAFSNQVLRERPQKMAAMLDAFFDPKKPATSFRECYVELTGDTRVTGRRDKAVRLTEAANSGTFADMLGDAITRRVVEDYKANDQYDLWRRIATVVPVADFRTQERARWGGYGDLPLVAESQAYGALDTPTDEKATYQIAKRGGTETLTLEMVRNDDVAMIRQIPQKLTRAAKRTLSKFVFDFIRTNPTIYDGKALFHADHGNLGTGALDAANFAAARLAMVRQTEYGGQDTLGVGPKYLMIPFELEETARNLFVRGTNQDPTFVQTLNPQILPIWYWTDASDWALAADPVEVPGIEVGFLDGKDAPELFVQDDPSSGSLFARDEITWKIRHIYGGAVVDWRGLRKHVVA